MELKHIFLELAGRFSTDGQLAGTLWAEIEKNYTASSRHYHNLMHVRGMISELEAVRKQIENFDVILFSVFYHDIVYKATAGDNEGQSAALARDRLRKLTANKAVADAVSAQIIATKKHERSADPDINYLLDADMATLGKDWESYLQYAAQIRKEYAVYPDFMYKPGRKKVLQDFLAFDEIYKTPEFREKYEIQARNNLAIEIESLQI